MSQENADTDRPMVKQSVMRWIRAVLVTTVVLTAVAWPAETFWITSLPPRWLPVSVALVVARPGHLLMSLVGVPVDIVLSVGGRKHAGIAETTVVLLLYFFALSMVGALPLLFRRRFYRVLALLAVAVLLACLVALSVTAPGMPHR